MPLDITVLSPHSHSEWEQQDEPMASGVTIQKNQLWGSKTSQAREEAGRPRVSEKLADLKLAEVHSSTSKVHQVAPNPSTWLSAAAWGSRWRST